MFSTSHPASSPPTGTCASHTRTKARSTPRTSLCLTDRRGWLTLADGQAEPSPRARSPHLRSTTTAQTSSNTRSPICLRTSRYRAPRSAYVCAAKATLCCSHPVDIPDSDCFGYNLTDGRPWGGRPLPHPTSSRYSDHAWRRGQ
jgi:hypothetical protein